VAKPEPYQPPRPAPDDYEITTRRGIDGAEIIYPTTTYRPVDLYLPTKGSEKFLLNFKKSNNKNKNYNDDDEEDNNETEENLESLEIITKEKSASSGGKKRIKKVRKVLRNSAARSLSLSTRNSTSNRFSEKEKHPEPRCQLYQHLRAAFLYKRVLSSFSVFTNCKCLHFWRKNSVKKAARKMLMKLTIELK